VPNKPKAVAATNMKSNKTGLIIIIHVRRTYLRNAGGILNLDDIAIERQIYPKYSLNPSEIVDSVSKYLVLMVTSCLVLSEIMAFSFKKITTKNPFLLADLVQDGFVSF
jgi:hypothetical protein